MKWYIKIILFIFIFVILLEAVSLLFIPNLSNLWQFGLFNKAQYDLLSEKNDTIDVVFLGDSLVYSSIIPMEIYERHGFTSFDCAIPVQTVDNTYRYLEIAFKSQHPKLVMIEADVLYRDAKSKYRYKNELTKFKHLFPILTFHNNWKQIGKGETLNIYKGYKMNMNIQTPKNRKYKQPKTKEYLTISDYNKSYFEKFLKLCNDNDATLVLISNPTLTSFSYSKHNYISDLARENGVDFIDLNVEDVGIDWDNESKDGGRHLNYAGAKKVSIYLGNYIESLNIVEDRRNDENYSSWAKAYELYKKSIYE